MNIINNVSLAPLTTFSIGNYAKYIIKPKSFNDCFKVLEFIKLKQLNYFILGGGSNVIIGSYPFNGAVISTLELNEINIIDNVIYAGAGVINTNLSLFTCKNSIKGFEFLYWMPGTIGGSSVMNARAFGSSMSDVVIAIDIIDENLKYKRIYNKDLDYSYKNSIFHKKNYFIVRVLLKLSKGNKLEIKEKMDSNKNKRLSTKQHDFPSAGCIFKNNYDIGIPSGKIIDSLGLKNFKIGNAKIYKHHANFIINCGKAHSDDVISLINLVKEKALNNLSIKMDCEVKFLGNFDKA